MNLGELRDTIANSGTADWRRIEGGPVYRDRFVHWESPANGTSGIEVHSHSSAAVYQPDIDLTLAYGMDAPGATRQPSFTWATFPDPDVSIHIADVFWRGALVDRVDFVYVDGGRCILPIGDGHQGLRITRYGYAVARLLDSLENGDRFEEYCSGVPYEYQD